MLDKICFADYIDRVTFKKQIWQFNEMSSLIKTFSTNYILHNSYDCISEKKLSEIRFTKVLTKYSTEYNNSLFIQDLCQKLSLDKKDLFSFFIKLKSVADEEDLCSLNETYDITKLDINRIYRYIDKYTNENYSECKYKNNELDIDIDNYNINEFNNINSSIENDCIF